MGIRETLNEKPAITTGATLAIVVIAIGFIIYQLVGTSTPQVQHQAFFTSDDGKTTFADDMTKVPPFDHDGKPAVRAMVFSCDDGKTRFVAWLERYTPEGKKKLEDSRKAGASADPGIIETVEATGKEVKTPGTPDTEWTRQTTPEKYSKITAAKCPDGKTDNIQQVLP